MMFIPHSTDKNKSRTNTIEGNPGSTGELLYYVGAAKHSLLWEVSLKEISLYCIFAITGLLSGKVFTTSD